MHRLLLRLPILAALLFFAAALHAQPQIPAVGDDHTFNVATWNIMEFGNPQGGPPNAQLQFDNVRAVMEQANVHLWALQEMANQNVFNELVLQLGDGWAGAWTNGTGMLGYGMIYRTDVVQPLQITNVLTNFSFEFASRPPQLMRANITLPGGTVQNVRILNLHAKANAGGTPFQNWQRRYDASVALKNYTDNFLAINAPVMVLGDFNNELGTSISTGYPSPYANFRDDENYFFVTQAVENAGKNTFCFNATCTNGSTIDHILLNAPMAEFFDGGDRYDALLSNIPNYVYRPNIPNGTTSDHIAVYARLNFFPVSAEDSSTPERFALEAPFPNPFNSETTVQYHLPQAATVQLEAFDALGRRVATIAAGAQSAGSHTATLSGERLTPGMYLIRLTAETPSGRQTATRRIVRMP